MTRTLATILLITVCTACASQGSGKGGRNATATTLQVTKASVGRKVLAEVPPESAMERFELLNREGHRVSYVAFTDTDFGGLVFLDDKLYGTVSRRDARAFYSCRGYATATHYHWARDALDWIDSLILATTPADLATLDFSGKTSYQSVKEVVSNPVLSDVKSLVDMGTNPLSIFKTLSSAHSNMVEREKYEKTLTALSDLKPGDSEEKVAKIIRPEDLSFTTDGMVMAYPRFSIDFYVSAGVVKVLQQPSFHRLSRLHAAIFYVPDLHWDQCTPSKWMLSLPGDWKPPPAEEKEEAANTSSN